MTGPVPCPASSRATSTDFTVVRCGRRSTPSRRWRASAGGPGADRAYRAAESSVPHGDGKGVTAANVPPRAEGVVRDERPARPAHHTAEHITAEHITTAGPVTWRHRSRWDGGYALSASRTRPSCF